MRPELKCNAIIHADMGENPNYVSLKGREKNGEVVKNSKKKNVLIAGVCIFRMRKIYITLTF